MSQYTKVNKLLEIALNQLKEISKQNNIWADMSIYCQDNWKIDFQSLDPFSATEIISFHNDSTGEYSLIINVGNLKTYSQFFTNDALNNRVLPTLRNMITLLLNNDLSSLKNYILDLTTQRGSGCYLYEIKKIDEIAEMPEDIVKIHYY